MFFILMKSDWGKVPTSNQYFQSPTKEVITNEDIFYSTNPMETIRKLIKKLNIELISLLKFKPQTPEIKERIIILMEDIHRYGVSVTFNNDIYSFNISIFLLWHVLNKKLFIFTQVFTRGCAYWGHCWYLRRYTATATSPPF